MYDILLHCGKRTETRDIMFRFLRRKYAGGFEKGNAFLMSFAGKINALTIYTEENENLTESLRKLKMDFEFTVSPDDNRDMAKNEENIRRLYDGLKTLLYRGNWTEKDVRGYIDCILFELEEIENLSDK